MARRPGGQRNMSKTTNPAKSMTVDAIERAAHADRDAQPLTNADLKRMSKRRGRVPEGN